MTPLERPKNWRDLAAGFVLNNLSDEEIMLWKALCAQDPHLIEEAQQLQQTFNHFADIIPLHAPSHSLVENVRMMARDDLGCVRRNSQRWLQSPAMPLRDRRNHWQWLGMIVGGGAIVFLSVHVYLLHHQMQQMNERLLQLQYQLQNSE